MNKNIDYKIYIRKYKLFKHKLWIPRTYNDIVYISDMMKYHNNLHIVYENDNCIEIFKDDELCLKIENGILKYSLKTFITFLVCYNFSVENYPSLLKIIIKENNIKTDIIKFETFIN